MSRKQQTITLSIGETDKAKLEQLALELGALWGERANITQLMKDIARRRLRVAHNANWSEERIRALVQAANLLLDLDQVDTAAILADLILERGELSVPLRAELETRYRGEPASWRSVIDSYIRRQQPFRLLYQDAAEHNWYFTVRHACIRFREKRLYLEIWTEESNGNSDTSALVHNWTLRLDRLQGVEVMPAQGEWRPALDYLDVELSLFGGLAYAYQPRPEDISCEWLADQPVRRVVRRITSTFWFLREIYAYGPDCLIVSPPDVRERAQLHLQQANQRYTSS